MTRLHQIVESDSKNRERETEHDAVSNQTHGHVRNRASDHSRRYALRGIRGNGSGSEQRRYVTVTRWVSVKWRVLIHRWTRRRTTNSTGGLGIITALTVAQPPRGVEALRDEIRKCKRLTNKPFGVNVTLLPVGVPPDYEGIVRVILEEGVRIVETAGRNPKPVIVPLKKAGCVIIHKCVAIRHALSAAKLGADMISMDGFDCGGHPGEEDVGNWVLLAKAGSVLRSKGIPFVASGGCATGKQLAAALSMGAEVRW